MLVEDLTSGDTGTCCVEEGQWLCMAALAESTGDPCTLVLHITLFTRAVTACGEGIPPLTGVAGTTTGEEGFPPGL